MRSLFIILFIFTSYIASTTSILSAQENENQTPRLYQGKYWGYIKTDTTNLPFALQADFYLESPEDFKKFPQLNTILKMNLGGYNSPEYFTQVYKNIQFDFDNNILTLDEPYNDFIISAQLKTFNGRTRIEGVVWIRTTAQTGKLVLESESDEPGEWSLPQTLDVDISKFAPRIEGQYIGKCKNEPALFQIQTMRGLNEEDSRDGKQLFDYEIIGRLAYRRKGVPESDPRPWGVYSSYAGGVYNAFNGSLIFLGPSSTALECKLINGNLKCHYQSRDTKVPCEFNLENKKNSLIQKFSRNHHLSPTSEQLKTLPPASPPSNKELIKALGGHFVGYLHHEAYNRYQSMALHVVPSSSTDNPHNPNKAFISTTSVLYYGSTQSDLFITQRYEPRSFYLRPGFTLSAPGTDSFIVIDEWRSGFIRGTWYSHNYGRVGTVELIKGESLPALPTNLKTISPWQGEYQNLLAAGETNTQRWFKTLFPNLPSERIESTVHFSGSYLSDKENSSIFPMKRGRYDPYTGAIGWVYEHNNGVGMVSGIVGDSGSILLYWPPFPNVFSAALGDYSLTEFKPILN